MIKPINRDVNILRQVSQLASKDDLPVAQDLRDTLTANADRCRQLVENSIGIVTALNTRLGYETSASIAKEALESGRSVMDLVLEKQLLTREELDELLLPENMIHPFLK